MVPSHHSPALTLPRACFGKCCSKTVGKKKKKLGFFVCVFLTWGKTLKFSLSQIFPRTFPISLDNCLSRRVSLAGMHCGPHPSVLLSTGVNVTMPAQPGMPPLSSTQLQIDPALQEFQLVDLSRRFLVHDSFWTLPEQFLGNKVRDQPWLLQAGERPSCPPMLRTCLGVLLPLKLVCGKTDSALGERWALAYSFRVRCLSTTLKLEGMLTQPFKRCSWTIPPTPETGSVFLLWPPRATFILPPTSDRVPSRQSQVPLISAPCAQLCARHTVSARHTEGRGKAKWTQSRHQVVPRPQTSLP